MQPGTLRDVARFNPDTDRTTIVNHLTYDAFGRITGQSNPAVTTLLAFTGRPLDPATGLQNHLHRWYDPAVGRWLSEDPLGFHAADANPYRYCGNSRGICVDRSGLILETLWDAANIGLDLVSLGRNLYHGDLKGAAVDAGGLLVDVAATLIPCVPGGAGAGIKAARGAAKAADKAADAARAVDRAGDAARAARAAAFVERHHLLPREFADNFAKVGLDIEKFVIKLPQDAHRLKPGGLHTGEANWNAMWAQFFREHPNYTRQDVLDQLDKMKKLFGLE